MAKIYKTYRFINKDPIIDKMRTALRDSGTDEREACILSGLSPTTAANWFRGTTRRPQFASLNAFARAIDKELALIPLYKRGKIK